MDSAEKPTPNAEISCSSEQLRSVVFSDGPDRLQALASLPAVVRFGPNEALLEERVVKVLLDLIVVKFFASYSNKPIYVFGGFGLISVFISFLAGLWALYLKFFEGVSFISTPLPLLVVLTFLTGVLSTLMGLIAEIITRTYYESQGKQVYLVKDTINMCVPAFNIVPAKGV